MGIKRRSSPANALFRWMSNRSMKLKIFLALTLAFCALITLKSTVKKSGHFFIVSEATHAAGLIVLVYKLTTQKTCSGLSAKTQELTALFVVSRLMASTVLDSPDIHTLLDLTTLICTCWVIYMIRFKLKSTYIKELDNLPLYYVLVPCAILALLIYPHTNHYRVIRILWAFCVYVESVSVLPQLRLMQNAKMIEPFTGHYVFALGVARFFAFAHWIIQVYDTRGAYLYLIGNGSFWFAAAFLAEMVQSFILTDFCYYYIKRFVQGQLVMRMPV